MMERFPVYLAVLGLCSILSASAQNPNSTDNLRSPMSPAFSAQALIADSPYTELFADARLNDISFVNFQRGWAVGDHGVVWTTDDGGASWQLQKTPIDCSLNSVQFFDESFGIAVGHYSFPSFQHNQTQQGRGVILITRDGGKTWLLRHTPDLPPLYKIKMFNAQTLILAGATSEYCPSGLLLSKDGGNTWLPIISEQSDGFVAADFFDPNKGVGIGFHGILQQYQNGIAASQTDSLGFRQVSAVKANLPSKEFPVTAWAVGDRGLILSSLDQGLRWGAVPGTLPENAAEIVDLKTIEAQGKNLWVAGKPGTCIYMSNDAGQTWKRTLTGISATLRKIVFVNPQFGWAIGDLGTILSTQNGGQTWQIQRTGSTKLAVLGLFAEAESIPFEVFADLSADKGFLSGCAILFPKEYRSRENQMRLHESLVRIGGSVGMELGTFPIFPKELWTTSEKLAEHIQRITDGRGMSQLREQLVLAIRQWKPEVLITSNYTSPYMDTVAEDLALREIMAAVKHAGDSAAYPHHISELGLPAWNVKKVYLSLKNNTLGDLHHNPSEPTPRLGIPTDEQTFVSRNLVNAPPSPNVLGFICTTAASNNDFFSGIPLLPGEDGRRAQTGFYGEFHEEHRRRALQRRNILGILNNAAKSSQPSDKIVSGENIVSHAAAWTQRLDPESAVQILLRLGEQFHQNGDWNSASETFHYLAQHYPQHPLVRQAFVRLMQYAVSSEMLIGEQQQNSSISSDGGSNRFSEFPASTQTLSPEGRGGDLMGVQSGQVLPISDRAELQRKQSALLQQFLAQNIPDLADDVLLRFATASAWRKYGRGQDAALFYRKRGGLQFDDIWGTRARTEYWLTVQDKTTLPMEHRESPMPTFVCNYTGNKPYLDGKFDSKNDRNVWQRTQVYALTPETPRQRLSELINNHESKNKRVGQVREEQLRQSSQQFGTQVMFLYDPEYWYIGFRCPKVPEVDYPAAKGGRIRDAVTPERDRIEILVDADRDYGTYYSLTIDSQGNVTDRCLGDRHWNPQWYVAQSEDENAWYIEAAIPFSSLLERSPGVHKNAVWGFAVRRLVPDKGIECWNAENSWNLTEGFGLLVFP